MLDVLCLPKQTNIPASHPRRLTLQGLQKFCSLFFLSSTWFSQRHVCNCPFNFLYQCHRKFNDRVIYNYSFPTFHVFSAKIPNRGDQASLLTLVISSPPGPPPFPSSLLSFPPPFSTRALSLFLS